MVKFMSKIKSKLTNKTIFYNYYYRYNVKAKLCRNLEDNLKLTFIIYIKRKPRCQAKTKIK
jgi:hypothetical protein